MSTLSVNNVVRRSASPLPNSSALFVLNKGMWFSSALKLVLKISWLTILIGQYVYVLPPLNCTYASARIQTLMHTNIHLNILLHTQSYTYIYSYTRKHTLTYNSYTRKHTLTYTLTHANIHLHTLLHTQTHVHVCIYVHTILHSIINIHTQSYFSHTHTLNITCMHIQTCAHTRLHTRTRALTPHTHTGYWIYRRGSTYCLLDPPRPPLQPHTSMVLSSSANHYRFLKVRCGG